MTRRILLSVALVGFSGLLAGVPASSSVSAEEPLATVGTLLKVEFRRVIGTEHGGAAVFPDLKSKWANHTLGSPTVHFDGTTYRTVSYTHLRAHET